MGQPSSPKLLVAMAEGKGDLEGLRSATKCPSLEGDPHHFRLPIHWSEESDEFSQQQGPGNTILPCPKKTESWKYPENGTNDHHICSAPS